ncbi:hypothetical protein SLU01_13120 [Sporosarcina luteola]|uniref:Uncharacterized protein n=1 Tax=Sporosarcina luteola TaxID=582850 RepID=A0A511Z6E0_9BACL|nr:hypothetical protein [Sporosarcina luteola]GEN83000.1 hypothetical protein SLU01_13120 [Sporosarcina luteola]
MFDINKIMLAAEKLGLQIELNAENPGMHFVREDNTSDYLTYDDLSKNFTKEFFADQEANEMDYHFNYSSFLNVTFGNHFLPNKSQKLEQIEITVGDNRKTTKNSYYASFEGMENYVIAVNTNTNLTGAA